jgi:hypothetical protein
MKSNKGSITQIILFLLLAISLGLNIFIIYVLSETRNRAVSVLENSQVLLDQVATQPIETVVHVDQPIYISETLPVRHTFTIPIDTVYPLSTVIRTTVQIPLLGAQEIAAPIESDIPIQTELSVPIDTSVPLSFTYRLQTDIPVSVDLPENALRPIEEVLQQSIDALR